MAEELLGDRTPLHRLPPADLAKLHEAFRGKTDSLHSLIRTFLDGAPARLDGLRAAQRAGDASAVAELTHALRGSLTIFSAECAIQLVQELEDLAEGRQLEAVESKLRAFEEEMERVTAFLEAAAGEAIGEVASGGTDAQWA